MLLCEIAPPQSYEGSGKPVLYKSNTTPITKMMSAQEIVGGQHGIVGVAYYNNVVDDYDAGDNSWAVTQQVLKYANYLKHHPETVKNLPPIIIVDGKLQDGSHRTSAIWLLSQRLDPNNPLWKGKILKVEFVTSDQVNT